MRDDGAGFDPHRRSSGFGLVGMRERLALVRGTLDIETAPGGGTTLRASIPLRRDLKRGLGAARDDDHGAVGAADQRPLTPPVITLRSGP